MVCLNDLIPNLIHHTGPKFYDNQPQSPTDSQMTATHLGIPEETDSMPFISKLQKEVQLMMRLDHPHVIKVFQVLETEDECYIVM